jgi:hypothetical protein
LLRKVVDRQSRWRPREQRFDSLDDQGKELAASLADGLGASLRSLRHVEGPIFPLLLRARAGRIMASTSVGGEDCGASSSSIAIPGASVDRWQPEVHGEPLSLGGRAEVLHLVDVCPVDLRGLWEPLCPRLQKLVLLNLPASAPGRTASAVAAFLPKAPNLTDLQLDFQYFDPSAWDLEALDELVQCVQAEPSKVTKFALEWCRLGDAGVGCVCRTLARTSPSCGGVTELSLAHCEMRDVGSVCEMLETPGLALTKLDLSSNGLDDSQAVRLAKALPLSQVKELKLRDSQISVPLPVKVEWFWGC